MTDQVLPRHGIARIAFTPETDPAATVVCEGRLHPASDDSCEARRAALAASTRFSAPPDWHLVVAFTLPAPIEAAIDAAGRGSLQIWSWADPTEHDHAHRPFLSRWMPRVRLDHRTPDGGLVLALETGPVFMLPYLAQLPADERPHALWETDDRLVVWPVGALPAVTAAHQ
jgi:hypothetical protein